jgi:hypothetical protein
MLEVFSTKFIIFMMFIHPVTGLQLTNEATMEAHFLSEENCHDWTNRKGMELANQRADDFNVEAIELCVQKAIEAPASYVDPDPAS